jgi:hypothetical protein
VRRRQRLRARLRIRASDGRLGPIGGQLLARALIGLIGLRAFLVSVIPGLLAALAIVYAILHAPKPTTQHHQPIRLRQTASARRARAAARSRGPVRTREPRRDADAPPSERPAPAGRSHNSGIQLVLVLYAAYNLDATLISVPPGRPATRRGMLDILIAGACFTLGYIGFAASGASIPLLATAFVLAGLEIGCAETGRERGRRSTRPADLRGSAFGLLSTIQAVGNLADSAIAGILWTAISPAAALIYVGTWMALAVIGLTLTAPPSRT